MKIKYYVKGIDDAAKPLRELRNSLGECRATLIEGNTLLELSSERWDEAELVARTEEVLRSLGIEFTRAEDNGVYIRRGKQARGIPAFAVICAMITTAVISVLVTFAICKANEPAPKPAPAPEYIQGESTTEYVVMDVPKYFEDLIKLDDFFKKHSFDGYDEDEMAEAILDAYIASTGDIYAEYLNAEEYAEYFEERAGEFVGIGVSIVNSEIEIDGSKYRTMEVIAVFKGSPAMESGVMVGDCIMYVESEGEMKLVNSIGYTNALDCMLGESGTLAKFTVFRPRGGDFEEISFEIERRKVESESVNFRVSESDSTVGIINITGFDLTTPTQFKEAVSILRDVHKCKYFVFDVRNNPGGSLDSIETVLSYFLREGDEIVSTEYADGTKESSKARAKKYIEEYAGLDVKKEELGMYRNLNFTVLTNENTASAAELFTATMRDYGLSKIVGKTTYGKGCMQTLYPLSSIGIEGGLKLTVAMYYSASKTVYHGTGIVPDYEVDLSDEAKNINFYLLPEEMDAQLQKAIELLTK